MYVGPLAGPTSPDDFAFTDAQQTPNISQKNSSYCEVTALQQIALLHADRSSDIVGLEHYRRRFVNGPSWLKKIIRSTQKSSFSRRFSNCLLAHFALTHTQAAALLADREVIVPRAVRLQKSVRQSYFESHLQEDWQVLKQIIETDFADYADAFCRLENSHTLHLYNMFVARAGFVTEYVKWLLAVMERLDMNIDLTGRDRFQTRVFGFLSERLFNVYLLRHAHLRVIELPVVQLYNESVVSNS